MHTVFCIHHPECSHTHGYVESLIQALLSTLLCEGLTTFCMGTECKSYTSELFNMTNIPKAVTRRAPPTRTPDLCRILSLHRPCTLFPEFFLSSLPFPSKHNTLTHSPPISRSLMICFYYKIKSEITTTKNKP